MTDVNPNLERCATCGKYFIQHVEKWSRYATCGKFKKKVEDKLEAGGSAVTEDKPEAVGDRKGQTGGCGTP